MAFENTTNLDQVMQEGLARFEETIGPGSPGDPADPGPASGSPADPPKTTATKEEAGGSPPVADPEHPEAGQKPSESKPPGKRFGSVEEAEAAKVAAEAARTAAEERENTRETFVAETREKTLVAIDELDPDAATYRKEVAKIQAKEEREIRAYDREHQLPAPQAPPPARAPETGPDPDLQAGIDYVDAQAKEAGIDPADALYIRCCQTAPRVDAQGNPLLFKDQVAWAIAETKNYQKAQRDRYLEEQRQAAAGKGRANQETHEFLGRRGAGPSGRAAEETIPVVSLEDAIRSVQEERKL